MAEFLSVKMVFCEHLFIVQVLVLGFYLASHLWVFNAAGTFSLASIGVLYHIIELQEFHAFHNQMPFCRVSRVVRSFSQLFSNKSHIR